MRPGPAADLRVVLAVLARIRARLQSPLDELLAKPGGLGSEPRHPVDDVDGEVEAVEIVEHDHVERRRGRSFLLVAADVQVPVVRPPVREAVDQPRIAVVREDDRPVGREDRVELRVGQAVWVLGVRLEAHQVDDVDDADHQVGKRLAQKRRRRKGLERRDVAGAREHDVRRAAAVVRGPLPDAQATGAMHDRVVHGEVVQRRLLPRDDHVHVVPAAQAVVGDGQERVRVRREVDADDLGLLVHDVVDEAGILVREAVVVLSPDVRAEQVVERGDRPPPGDAARDLQPLRVLVEHRVHDVDERLVAVEEPVPAGQQVALEPALAEMLGQHLDDAALRRQAVVGRLELRVPDAVRDAEDVAEAVRRRLVRAEDAEVLLVPHDDVLQEPAEDARRLARRRPRRVDLDRVVAEVREREVAEQLAAVCVRFALIRLLPRGGSSARSGCSRPSSSNSSSGR